ncbi:MAG: MBL fold metallo-hydrolase [Candidatus Cryptobacteroides sp.]
MISITKFIFNSFEEQCYLCWSDRGDGRAVLIDPGFDSLKDYERLRGTLDANGLEPAAILLTHSHPDHIYGVGRLCRDYGLKVYMHRDESVSLDAMESLCREIGHTVPDGFRDHIITVEDGQTLDFGTLQFRAIATPGHTAGGLSWLCRETEGTGLHCGEDADEAAGLYDRGWKILFSGDTLFAGCIGRSDLPGGDYDRLMESIMTRLMALDGRTDVLPGHGRNTTVGDEGMKNPFLQPFNEPEFDF